MNTDSSFSQEVIKFGELVKRLERLAREDHPVNIQASQAKKRFESRPIIYPPTDQTTQEATQ